MSSIFLVFKITSISLRLFFFNMHICIYLCILFFKFSFLHRKYNIIFSSILIIGVVTIIGKNLIRIYKTDDNYFNYPWPKYYSMDIKNRPTNLNKTILNEKIILYQKKGKYCMYIENLCSNYGVENNLKLLKTNKNYLLFFK